MNGIPYALPLDIPWTLIESGNAFAVLSGCRRKEVSKMPWYTNPTLTCKVLEKIANRYERTELQDLKSVMDHAATLIWRKQECYYAAVGKNMFR